MTGDTIHIRVEPAEEFHDSIREDLRAIDEGRDLEDANVLSVPDLATLSRILSETNLELLRAIAAHEPESMRALARAVERDIKNVSEDLEFLGELDLVEFETDGRAKRPIVPYDDIEVEVPVRDDADRGGLVA